MPTSDRTAPGSDRPKPKDSPRDAGRARMADAPIEPPQYFDPAEPWDAQSAEALMHLYDSGEGYLHPRPEDERARRLRQSQVATPAAEPASHDNAWLEARLAEMAERLQTSLTEMNPDKAAAHLNRRLDAIEERFNEALSHVVQRSDLDGLKLIEAHVIELAAHVEHTRGRLDRIDAIDDQMQTLARRLEEGDHQRLDALEKLLQDYVAEWRKGDDRTASALRSLEDVVSRIGESVEAMEAQKPAPDLSLSVLGTPGLVEPAIEAGSLSQVYTDARRLLEPIAHRSSLDAADYAPKGEPEAKALAFAPSHERSQPAAEQQKTTPGDDSVPSPSLLVSMMRTKLRQALGVGKILRSDQHTTVATGSDPTATPARRRVRPNLLLTGGVTLFAAIGYLLVDVFMNTSAAPRRPAETEHSTLPPADAKAAAALPVALPRVSDHAGTASSAIDWRGENATPASGARIEAIGNAMAAAFRQREGTERPPVKSTSSIQKDTPSTLDETVSPTMVALPMTIGPASLRQAALRGDPAAQVEVGARYAAGQGVGRDLQQTFLWYGRAAAQGLGIAQYRFAALYERGLGTTRDAERARIWYARAAEQGNVKAMHNLAVLSVSGSRSEYAAAAKWFTQAADFGLADSQVNLAILYQNGLGVPKDLKLAYKWLALAKRGGDQEAASRAIQVRALLGAAELEAMDAAIAAWRPRTPDPVANETAAATPIELSQ
jgi:TPR repeat protein